MCTRRRPCGSEEIIVAVPVVTALLFPHEHGIHFLYVKTIATPCYFVCALVVVRIVCLCPIIAITINPVLQAHKICVACLEEIG